MNELNGQTCQLGAAHAGEETLSDMKAPNMTASPAMASLFEPVVGLVSMSRICAYFLKREEPDMEELRKVVGMLVSSSEIVLAMVQNDPHAPL